MLEYTFEGNADTCLLKCINFLILTESFDRIKMFPQKTAALKKENGPMITHTLNPLTAPI